MFTLIGIFTLGYIICILPVHTKSSVVQFTLCILHMFLTLILFISGLICNSPIIILGFVSALISFVLSRAIKYNDIDSGFDYIKYMLEERLK